MPGNCTKIGCRLLYMLVSHCRISLGLCLGLIWMTLLYPITRKLCVIYLALCLLVNKGTTPRSMESHGTLSVQSLPCIALYLLVLHILHQHRHRIHHLVTSCLHLVNLWWLSTSLLLLYLLHLLLQSLHLWLLHLQLLHLCQT